MFAACAELTVYLGQTHTHTPNAECFPIKGVLFWEFYLGKNKGTRGMYLTQSRAKEELLEDVGL